jgi:hypothetical protein
MNLRDSVPDADSSCRSGQDDASGAIGVIEGTGETGETGGDTDAGHGDGQPTRILRAHRPLQDIQDIIDKLAAVTQQLRRPGSRPHA